MGELNDRTGAVAESGVVGERARQIVEVKKEIFDIWREEEGDGRLRAGRRRTTTVEKEESTEDLTRGDVEGPPTVC